VPEEVLIPFRGQLRTYREIGLILGVSPGCIRHRHKHGEVIDSPSLYLVRGAGEKCGRRMQGANVTNDRAPYSHDSSAQAANQYLLAREPLHSVQEIAELMDCSLEDALLYRYELRASLFRSAPTLEIIGGIMGISRERVRQLEERATQRIRGKPSLWPILKRMQEDASELDRGRPVDRYESIATSGTIQVGDWSAKPAMGHKGRIGE
jgi:hypothetical protein